MSANWPRKFRTYWCVVDERGTAFLQSARSRRASSIASFMDDADPPQQHDWIWWRQSGYTCQRCDIKVRNAVSTDKRSHGYGKR